MATSAQAHAQAAALRPPCKASKVFILSLTLRRPAAGKELLSNA
jgi:hypothetical protein